MAYTQLGSISVTYVAVAEKSTFVTSLPYLFNHEMFTGAFEHTVAAQTRNFNYLVTNQQIVSRTHLHT